MAASSRVALWEGETKVGGDANWATTMNSTSLTEVRGGDDGRLLLRMEQPPANEHVMISNCFSF